MPHGKLSIHRVHGSEEYVAIDVIDEISGVQFLEVKVDIKTFGEVITGLSRQDVEFNLNSIELVGLKRENKHEIVERPRIHRGHEGSDEEIAKILSRYEVDGWKARISDIHNHHNWVGTDRVKVVFVRHVKVGE